MYEYEPINRKLLNKEMYELAKDFLKIEKYNCEIQKHLLFNVDKIIINDKYIKNDFKKFGFKNNNGIYELNLGSNNIITFEIQKVDDVLGEKSKYYKNSLYFFNKNLEKGLIEVENKHTILYEFLFLYRKEFNKKHNACFLKYEDEFAGFLCY
ncbi:hypothetical protein H9W57_001023 [Campylobacter jejuni]|nr:hypothetical protein [Campylobacter jejuni]EGX8973997.1 hypothetical protein [Campylobacter jejuni]